MGKIRDFFKAAVYGETWPKLPVFLGIPRFIAALGLKKG
jgi:hypothetical protein